MKIIVDAHGGDHAPLEIIKGCRDAVSELGVEILLVGNKEQILKISKENNISLEKIDIENAEKIMTMSDEPTSIIKENSDTSMGIAFNLLNENKGEALVSAGNTGTLLVGASLITKRIKGIKRACLAPVVPSFGGYIMLVDAGANVECRPEMLAQFGMMGSIYMNKVLNVTNPKVGLVNNGSEESKGRSFEKESYELLSKENINFIGNVEARNIADGVCDVVVTDGFTGNVILKLMEGMGKSFSNVLKEMFMSNILTKLSSLPLKGKLKSFKNQMDYKEQGGAIFLGVRKPVIKAHGSSDARAIKNAIRQAKKIVDSDIINKIGLEIAKGKE